MDRHVAELIAAGEVVERPSSAIKELVENSIDAGADTVAVEIKNGGTTYLRVTDNGCGMAREDVPVAFLRHATSKIREQDDLDSIATLGFRGEALASICAVSRVELITRRPEDEIGTRYVIEGGDGGECEDVGCPVGTTLIARDLFYNTPARMKFLKKDTIESNSVAGVLDRMALSHPEVSLRLIRDGKETLHTPGGGSLKSAVYAVYGKDFTAGLIPVEYELGGVRITGFISKPAASRPNRSMQHFFLNGRYIHSRTAQIALETAFKGSIMVGKFPSCVLHIHMAFEAVDVNIHPAKLEVRFLNEKPIFDAVYHGVRTALNKGDSPSVLKFRQEPIAESETIAPSGNPEPVRTAIPAESAPAVKSPEPPAEIPEKETAEENSQKPQTAAVRPVTMPDGWRPASEPPRVRQANIDIEVDDDEVDSRFRADAPIPRKHREREEPVILHDSGAAAVRSEPSYPQPVLREIIREQEPAAENPPPEAAVLHTAAEKAPERLIGEAFGTYILVERGEELILIDKHAAHERMLYEKLRTGGGENSSQMLLAPVPVTLDKDSYAAAIEAADLFAKAGFEIDDFGSGTVLVRSAPLWIDGGNVASAVMEMAGYLESSRADLTTDRLDWLYHNVACRAAVKAGDESSPQELMDLVRRLEEDPNIRYCPHGRPVSIIMKRKDLEKQFGRIQ